MPLLRCAFIGLLLLLVSCGAEEPAAELSPTGYWAGYMSPRDGEPIEVELMVLDDGTAFINREDGTLVGNVTSLDDRFILKTKGYAILGETWNGKDALVEGSLTGHVYPPGALEASFESLNDASLLPGSLLDQLSDYRSLIGDYEHGDEKGVFELINYPLLYTAAVTLDDVKGAWALPDEETGSVAAPTMTGILSANAAGEFDGNTPHGCQFVGRIIQESVSPPRNAFKVDGVSAYCPEYEGLALNGQFNGGSGIAFLAGDQNQYLATVWIFEWTGGGMRATWVRQ